MGKSSGLAIVLAGARVFCLGMLALLTSTCDSGVGAVTFGFSGFQENSLHPVLDSSWIFDITTGCFYFDPPKSYPWYSFPGRFLYPGAVQMIDPGATTVKSFSTSFIYQLRIVSDDGNTGPGMAFNLVPDNVTIGANLDFMGLITNETSGTEKNYASDNHTLGVELDTFQNPEFNDPNENHIGINLASMNSTYTIKPVYSLASSNADLYQQIWIDYDEADSRMDIYYANYNQGKPVTPQGNKTGLDLSLLKENMYIGFSTAKGIESSNVPYVCAWSFSNDGIPAPPIVIAQDATPGAPPPPAPGTPPPPAPVTPAPPPRNGPVAAPSQPPPASISSPPSVPTQSPAPGPPQVPPLPSPSPISPSPNGSATPPSASPPPFIFSPSPSSPLIAPSPGPGHGPRPINVRAIVGGCVATVLVVSICLFSLSNCWCKVRRRLLRVFISHTGGPNGAGKNFPSWLHQAMSHHRWSKSKFHVKPFLDVENCPKGLSFARKILKELARFDVGVVVVTPDFFERHWPMTELIKFVEVQKKDREGRIRVLPLFYELTPDQLKQGLDEGKWEHFWVEPSEDNHPLELQECRDAVSWLCKQVGIPYVSEKRDYDKAYIDTILAEVDKILYDERSIAADLRWAIKKLNITRSIPTATQVE